MQRIMFLGLGLCILFGCVVGCRERSSSQDSPAALPSSSPAGTAGEGQSAIGDNSALSAAPLAAPITNAVAELADHGGLLQRIQQAKGRVVVVDVWSTSCVPCMQEFPHLVELARRWPEDVVCISLNVDYLGLPNTPASESLPKVVEFLNSQGARADNIVNLVSSEPDTDVLSKMEIGSMPAIFVTDRQGKPVATLTTDSAGSDGLTYAGDVVPLVEKLIEAK